MVIHDTVGANCPWVEVFEWMLGFLCELATVWVHGHVSNLLREGCLEADIYSTNWDMRNLLSELML